jgi:hypothetical protein
VDLLPPPARYFPVKPSVFRFQAGLHPFGTDFGNGATDGLYFQVDAQRQHYLHEKQRVSPGRHGTLTDTAAERRANRRVLEWVRETLRREHARLFTDPPPTFRGVAAEVQEDLVVMHRHAGGTDAAIAVDVSFPSDWRPERILGTDFRFIHGPVPGFADHDAQARSLVTSMIERGPYVRFVWTLKPDDDLDHHPDRAAHRDWSADGEGFLRVERQVTVPFPEVAAALFLIRTYLYPFASLSAAQRAALAQAVEIMPPAAAAYKGFVGPREIILGLLRRATRAKRDTDHPE